MTVENMKGFLTAKWTGSAWAKKVAEMSDEQVIAIYYRLVDSTQNRHVVHISPKSEKENVYTCLDCGKEFLADNSELSECRFCGSTHMTRDYRKVYIRKEDDDED